MYNNEFRQQDRKLWLGQSYQIDVPSYQSTENVTGSMGRKEKVRSYGLYFYCKKSMDSKHKQDTSSRDQKSKRKSKNMTSN